MSINCLIVCFFNPYPMCDVWHFVTLKQSPIKCHVSFEWTLSQGFFLFYQLTKTHDGPSTSNEGSLTAAWTSGWSGQISGIKGSPENRVATIIGDIRFRKIGPAKRNGPQVIEYRNESSIRIGKFSEIGRNSDGRFQTFEFDVLLFHKWRSSSGVSISVSYAGHILTKKGLAGRIKRKNVSAGRNRRLKVPLYMYIQKQ